MSRLNAANNAKSRLAEPMYGSTKKMVVEDSSGFPDVPFLLSVEDEIVKVTDVDEEELTVERSQEGTSEEEHDEGSVVENLFTAGMWRELSVDLSEIENMNVIEPGDYVVYHDDNIYEVKDGGGGNPSKDSYYDLKVKEKGDYRFRVSAEHSHSLFAIQVIVNKSSSGYPSIAFNEGKETLETDLKLYSGDVIGLMSNGEPGSKGSFSDIKLSILNPYAEKV